MTIKHVKLSKEVHEKLSYLKEKSNAKSFNDVILSLLKISEEFYINEGKLKVANKKILLRYENGKLVEIEVRK